MNTNNKAEPRNNDLLILIKNIENSYRVCRTKRFGANENEDSGRKEKAGGRNRNILALLEEYL